MGEYKILEGNDAISEAVKLARVDVIAVFPITPMTTIANKLAQWGANGVIDSEVVLPENEHGALSVCLGAAATGARTFTASSSQGVVFMEELIWQIPGFRLPVVATISNRSIGTPGSLQCTHSDSLLQRDTGWLQLYCENAQEALDTTLMAYKIAEDERVLLPTFTTMDGYTVSACAMPVEVPDQNLVDQFLPPYEPEYYMNPQNPPELAKGVPSEGELRTSRVETELRYHLEVAHENAKLVIKEVNEEYGKLFGRSYGNGLIEKYRCENASSVLVTMGSITGTARVAIDEMREQGHLIGLVKLKSFRPFPTKDLRAIGKQVKAIGFIDRNFSHGSAMGAGIGNLELARTLYDLDERPKLLNFIAGIGGRDVTVPQIKDMAKKVLRTSETGLVEKPVEWVQLYR
jgi:pyruvate ferredoxin oxidoreductase alpha subunit